MANHVNNYHLKIRSKSAEKAEILLRNFKENQITYFIPERKKKKKKERRCYYSMIYPLKNEGEFRHSVPLVPLLVPDLFELLEVERSLTVSPALP